MRPRTRLYARWLVSIFRLPVEVRIMIYHLVWKNAIFIDVEWAVSKHRYTVGRYDRSLVVYDVAEDRHLFSLLQTCRFFRLEARPFLFEHLALVLRGTLTSHHQPTTTCLLLKEVRLLTCSPYRALRLDFTNPSRLEVLAIAHKNHLPRGMSMEQARTLVKADLPKLRKFYTGDYTHANRFPHSAACIADPISSVLIGLQSISPGHEAGIAKEAEVHVCLETVIFVKYRGLTTDKTLSRIFTETSSVIPSGHTLGLLSVAEGVVEVHSLHGNKTGHSDH